VTVEPFSVHVEARALRDAEDVLAERLERPPLPDLVSTPEAADILGVKPQRVHQLAIERDGFPERPAAPTTVKLTKHAPGGTRVSTVPSCGASG
jgi:hypothetical protein